MAVFLVSLETPVLNIGAVQISDMGPCPWVQKSWVCCIRGPAGIDTELMLAVGVESDKEVLFSALLVLGVTNTVWFCDRWERDHLSLFGKSAVLDGPIGTYDSEVREEVSDSL